MSEEEKPLEFSARDLMPDWAQDRPRESPQDYAKRFGDGEERRGGGDRRGGDRRDGRPGGRPGGRERGEGRFDERRGAPRGPGAGGGGGGGGGGRERRSDERGGGRGGEGRGGGGRFEDRRGGGRRPEGDRGGRGGDRRTGSGPDRDRPREEPLPTGIAVSYEPSGPAIEGLVRHIRETFRTFPLGDLAKMLLEARERYRVRFSATDPVRLHTCVVDGSLWLTREEAISHLLSGPALEAYYVAEDLAVEPPSGNFGVVAVCGFSGQILGPPNHHEYQRNVARLHRERFSDMSLERYKSRVRMESGEEILGQWREQVSRVRQYRIKPVELPAAPEEVPAEEPAPEQSSALPEEGTAPADAAEPAAPEEAAPVEGEAPEVLAEDLPTASDEAPVEEEAPEAEESADAEESGETSEIAEVATPISVVEGPVFKTIEDVARHFRQHFADEAVVECSEAVVPGNVSGRLLSPPLLALLRQEGERLRRGFPLSMIQALCRAFEERGLRFFKRGKKALHVSSVRPKALEEGAQLTESIRSIVDYIDQTAKPDVAGLLEALVPGFRRSEGPAVEPSPEWSDAARAVLKDLRWLTAEGYVLEFPNTGLALGRQNRPAAQDAAASAAKEPKQAQSKAKSETKRERKPRRDSSDTATPVPAVAPPPAARDDLDEEDFVLPAYPPEDVGEGDPDDPHELPDSVNPVVTF